MGTGRTAIEVAAGDYHLCALLDNQSVKCWGSNWFGELGQGHFDNLGDNPSEMGENLNSIDLGTGRTAKQIEAGRNFSCALLDDNSVKCWGVNSVGQLGQGNTTNIGGNPGEMGDALPPIDLGTGRTAKKIAVGSYSACALLDNNTVKCWGDNAEGQSGQGHINKIGDEAGEMGDNLLAVDLGVDMTVQYISVGSSHACAVLVEGTMKCWGENNYGQLGQGHSLNLGDEINEMSDNLDPMRL